MDGMMIKSIENMIIITVSGTANMEVGIDLL